ncbi:seryl-tRNA Hypothetical protein, partial [Rhizoctonia solani]
SHNQLLLSEKPDSSRAVGGLFQDLASTSAARNIINEWHKSIWNDRPLDWTFSNEGSAHDPCWKATPITPPEYEGRDKTRRGAQNKSATKIMNSGFCIYFVWDSTSPKLNYEDLVHADQVTNAKDRNVNLPERTFEALRRDLEAWKTTTRAADNLRARQSHIGNSVRSAETPEVQFARRATLRDSVNAHEREILRLEKSLLAHGLRIPNTSHPNVPLGPEPNARVISTHGPELIPSDPKRDHNQLNEIQGMKFFDRDAGVISSGAGFTYLRGGGALLELALITYAMGVAVRKGFEPIITPDIVRRDVADRCGLFHETRKLKHENSEAGLVLAGTSEIPLAGAAMHAQALYNPQTLPRPNGLRLATHFGQRQALVAKILEGYTEYINSPRSTSDQELEYLRELQIELYTGLGIPFRYACLDMPSEELGAPAHRKYDIEAWMPGRGAWGEISSASNCTDYQSRRLHIRHRYAHDDTSTTGPLPYAHTLNGTAAAIPRLIIALIEMD